MSREQLRSSQAVDAMLRGLDFVQKVMESPRRVSKREISRLDWRLTMTTLGPQRRWDGGWFIPGEWLGVLRTSPGCLE